MTYSRATHQEPGNRNRGSLTLALGLRPLSCPSLPRISLHQTHIGPAGGPAFVLSLAPRRTHSCLCVATSLWIPTQNHSWHLLPAARRPAEHIWLRKLPGPTWQAQHTAQHRCSSASEEGTKAMKRDHRGMPSPTLQQLQLPAALRQAPASSLSTPPKTALFGPSHAHSMAPCPKGRLELGQVLHNPGVRPQPHKVGSGKGAGGGLQGGTSSWPGTPGLCRAAWLESQARVCQSTGSTAGVPLPGSRGCSGRALCSVKNFLSQGWPGHYPAQNLLTGPHCLQEELNLLFEPTGYSLPLIILFSAVPCCPRALPRTLATPPAGLTGSTCSSV